jgi:hypothetical protein
MILKFTSLCVRLTILFVLISSCDPDAEISILGDVHDGYTLVAPMNEEEVFLINNEGDILKSIQTGFRPGVDIQLIPDGRLLGVFKARDPKIDLGGSGGLVRIFDFEGNIEWQYVINSTNSMVHHDAEYLPNGNVLLTVWEKVSREEAIEYGLNIDEDVIVDYLLEISPETDEIVWEWHAWDHMVQDSNNELPNYGDPFTNRHKINFNYPIGISRQNRNSLTHCNGIAYDRVNDLIFLSINKFSEIWVIDHSTNTDEAQSGSGGNYNKGGDLIFRFGNPGAYNSDVERLFTRQHHPNFVNPELGFGGNMMVFVNRTEDTGSIVYELQIPDLDIDDPKVEVVWHYEKSGFFSRLVSGAMRLPNQNTLICEGDFGLFEVNPSGEIVWTYEPQTTFIEGNLDALLWRPYKYSKEHPLINGLNL